MTEENKKKNKIIGIGLGILIVLLVVISSTYAYWQITRSQEDVNKMVAACLNLDIKFNGGLTMEDQWPKEKYAAMRDLAGYTFTIENKCEDAVNYVIGLESVKDDKITAYMSHSAIALAMDNGYLGTYDLLGDLDGPTLDSLASKELKTATVEGKSTNTHNLKIWIDENAPIEEQGKGFAGRVFITGGQGLLNDNPQITATKDECFDIDENGEITDYNEEIDGCGTSVTIPATVNNVAVKTIDTDAFRGTTTAYNYDFITITDSTGYPQRAYILEPAREQEIVDWANENGFGSVEMHLYTETPSVGDGEMLLYCDITRSLDNLCDRADDSELTTTETKILITGLDLSQALNLERIEKAAFSNVDTSLVSEDDLESFANYPTSLTSLTFGEDKKELLIEDKAFARIDVDNLTLYSSYVSPLYQDGDVITPYIFGGAIIDNLVIKPASEKVVLGTIGTIADQENLVVNWYGGITANKVTLEEGINNINTSLFQEAKIGEIVIPNSYLENFESTKGLNFAKIGVLTLPNGITEIPAKVFGSVDVENLTIPYTIETIGDEAFKGAKLGNITFEDTTTNPSRLKAVNYKAFSNVSGLTQLTLPTSLETINEEAFASMTTIKKLTIPSSVTTIGDSAFNYCYNLTEIVFEDTTTNPSNLKSIGYRAFYYLPNVPNITLPASITSIGQDAFASGGSGTITVPMTQEVFNANVTAGFDWYGSYTVSYGS